MTSTTMLHAAALEGNVEEVLGILGGGDVSVSAPDGKGRTALFLAAKSGHLSLARALLDAGACPRGDDANEWMWRPLHHAADKGFVEVAALLLERGAGLEAATRSGGWTPLHLAARENRPEMVGFLLARGARLEAQAVLDWTPLHFAARNGSAEAARVLLLGGADVAAHTGAGGDMPLHLAVRNGHLEMVELLLRYKASPQVVASTAKKLTPLHFSTLVRKLSHSDLKKKNLKILIIRT